MTKTTKRMIFYTILVMLLGSAAFESSCKPDAVSKAVEVTGAGKHGELTAAVLASGKGTCTNGRIYLTSEGPHLLMRTLLNPGDGPFGVTMPGLGPSQDIKFSSDHQMARLANGDLLLMWQGSTSAPLTTSGGQALPLWWNDWGVKKQWDFDPTGQSPVGNNQQVSEFFSTHIGGRNGFRSANLLWRFSGDSCEWSSTPMVLDSGQVKAIARNGKAETGYCAQLAPGLAGFDRLEMYADPWGVDSNDKSKQRIYVSTFCGRCQKTPCPALQQKPLDDDNVQVFTSPDSGVNWFPYMRLKSPQPVAMTTTGPKGRLYMFNAVKEGEPDSGAKLYWLDSGGVDVSHGPFDITYETPDPKDPEPDPKKKKRIRLVPNWLDGSVVGVGHSGSAPLSLARTGVNGVLAVYPAVEQGSSTTGPVQRQIAVVVWAVNSPNGTLLVVPIKIIRAENDRGSVLLPTLIEDDRRDAPSATTMLYWIETTAQSPLAVAQTPMVAKYTFFTNGIFPGDPTYLTDATGWNANNTSPRAWLGDYMKGSFYADSKGLHFVAAWPQVTQVGSPSSPDNSKTQAYVRIITLQPQSLKDQPNPQTMPGVREAAFVGDKP